MTRLFHLLAIVLITSAVTAGLKVDGGKNFLREFAKSGAAFAALYVGLGAGIFLVTWFLGQLG